MAGVVEMTSERWTTVWQHHDLAAFAELALPLLRVDPVRHTVALTAITGQLRLAERHNVVVMLTVHDDGGALRGLVLQVAGWPLIASALPVDAAPTVAGMLADLTPDLCGVSGPRPQAEVFAAAWTARTGQVATVGMDQRLFRLGELTPPGGVPGAARLAEEVDAELVAEWRQAFAREAGVGRPAIDDETELVVRQLRAGHAHLLWDCDGEPVATAFASLPTVGMSRIGAVWTLPEQRGRGFGAAVTAAASRWALDAGAGHVLLFTDLTNPVSNAIYPRIGYHPVDDAVELRFQRGPD